MRRVSEWQFAQSFGTEESEEYGFSEDDIFTAVAFDASGDFIGMGDKAGRVTLFRTVRDSERARRRRSNFQPLEYEFHTEFQSHEKGFDQLHSVEIRESINKLAFWPVQAAHVLLLTTNDTNVKLWRIAREPPRPRRAMGAKAAAAAPSGEEEPMPEARCRRQFKGAHGTYHIESISVNSDGTTFLSSDSLRINIWDVESAKECFNAVNIQPSNISDLSEVITSASFHPALCNLLLYSTSLGAVHLCDLRDSALLKSSSVFQSRRPEGFFSEVVDGVSDARFSRDARFVFARDYLSTKVWDVRSDRKPLLSIPVHDFLEDYLRELHKNECIFDKFTLSLSPDGSHCVTGSYDSNFVVQGVEGAWCETVHASSEASRPSERPPANVRSREMKEYVAKMDFAKKSLQVCWHPRVNAVAVGSLNKVYIYQARSPPPAAAAPAAAVAAGAASAGSDGAKRV